MVTNEAPPLTTGDDDDGVRVIPGGPRQRRVESPQALEVSVPITAFVEFDGEADAGGRAGDRWLQPADLIDRHLFVGQHLPQVDLIRQCGRVREAAEKLGVR